MTEKFHNDKPYYLNMTEICSQMCQTTLSGDLSSSGFVDPLLEAYSLDSFQTDLGESVKGI